MQAALASTRGKADQALSPSYLELTVLGTRPARIDGTRVKAAKAAWQD